MSPVDDSPVKKIRGLEDLKTIKQQAIHDTALRDDGSHVKVTVHMGTCGIASGSRGILAAMLEELAASERDDVRVTTSGCIGVCAHEPEVTVEVIDTEPVLYGDIDADGARKIWSGHVMDGKVVPEFVIELGADS
jgi:NADP-reducing hydrogenase subunit HndB